MFLFLLYRDDTKSHFSFCFMFLQALHVTQAFYKTIYIGVCMRCVCMFYIRFTKVYSLEGYCFEPLYYFLSTSYNFSSLVYLVVVVFVFFDIISHCSISMVRLIGSSTRAWDNIIYENYYDNMLLVFWLVLEYNIALDIILIYSSNDISLIIICLSLSSYLTHNSTKIHRNTQQSLQSPLPFHTTQG